MRGLLPERPEQQWEYDDEEDLGFERVDRLSKNQYGLHPRHSTIDAVMEVRRKADEERSETWRTRRLCLLILIDVWKAFNSMPWDVVI